MHHGSKPDPRQRRPLTNAKLRLDLLHSITFKESAAFGRWVISKIKNVTGWY